MQKHLGELGIDFQFVEAIDGHSLNDIIRYEELFKADGTH